ncbi:MAG: peptide deformylase [Dermatophilaceae bacterium]
MSTWRGWLGVRSRADAPQRRTGDLRRHIDGIPVDRLPEIIAEARRGQRRALATVGDDVLARPCAEVEDPRASRLRALVDDLYATMAVCEGIGLAANQVGVPLKVFVYDCEDLWGTRYVGHVINPVLEIDPSAPSDEYDDEECPSIPGPVAEVARAAVVLVRGLTVAGSPVAIEATGRLARCFQHEVDHLEGALYLDRITPRARLRTMKSMASRHQATRAAWDDRARILGQPIASDLTACGVNVAAS